MTDLGTEALFCAERGWHVFPCSPKSKRPLTENGLNDATRDSSIIQGWWKKWPGAMIGVATGSQSGFFAIDLDHDPDKGLDGIATFESLKNGSDLPETITTQTPRGGRHLWFKYVSGVKNSAGKIAPGVDVRGEGGYVIAPPSRRADGVEYQFLVDDRDGPADAPQWLLDLLLPKESAFKQREQRDETDHADGNYARAALERECAAVTSAQPGGRNHSLNRAAFSLGQLVASGALSDSEVHDRLYGAAVATGLVKDDGRAAVEKTIASGLAAGMGKPRAAPKRTAKAHDQAAKPRRKKSESAGLEDRVALEFAQGHANHLRYVAASSQWMRWSGSYWEDEKTLAAFDEARKLCRAAGDAKAKTVAAVTALARSDRIIAATIEQWDSDPSLFNATGTTFDLITGIERFPDPADYITKRAACGVALAGTPHPLWDQFLARITAQDIELQRFLQRYIGYSCTGFIHEHVFVFAYGQGANGKSTFINTLTKILGDYATVADMNTFLVTRNERHPTDLAKLRGARLVVAQETQKGRRWDETKIKALTGGDKITARFMRQDYFDFMPTFKLFIAGNHRPRLSTIDEAMRRRMLVIPFTVQIPLHERDRTLPEKLWNEREAILRWCIDGCQSWQRIGLAPPLSVRKTTDEYFDDQDNLGQWIEDCTNPDAGIFGFELSSDLFASWREWCIRQNLNPGSEKTFVEALRDRGFERSRKEHGRGFAGIELKRGAECLNGAADGS
jgi:putative DNA primase/helicase